MTEQTWWLVGVGAVLAAAVIGFLVGRSKLGGANRRVDALEVEISRQKEEIAAYKHEVETHFDKTASLVASMAGSYKELFEHLSSGYGQLSSSSARQPFADRAGGLLENTAAGTAAADEGLDGLSKASKAPAPPVAKAPAPEDAEPSSAASEPDTGTVAASSAEAATLASAQAEATPGSTTDSSNASSPPLPKEAPPDGQDQPRPGENKHRLSKKPGP